VQLARADDKVFGIALAVARAALGHAPAASAWAVEGDIEGAVVHRIGRFAAPGPGVVGGEHAPDEGNQGQAVLAIVTQGVDVPPEVAA
jgi:hypothetical protein